MEERRQRRADGVADDDVRRRADGEPDARGPALGEVEGDLGARAAGPDDEHVLTGERRRRAVAGGVQDLAAEARAARPRGHVRAVLVAAGDDDVARLHLARGGDQPPAVVLALDALHAHAEPHVERVPARVLVEVGDELVARRERRRLERRAVGEPRVPARRVELEPVVAPAPGRRDRVRLLEHDRGHVRAPQLCGRRQSGRARADHDHLVHVGKDDRGAAIIPSLSAARRP